MTPLVYEVDGAEYLDRQARVKAILAELTAPKGFDVADWARRLGELQGEVEELPLVIGVRYRIRLLGGQMEFQHRHFKDSEGTVHGVDLPAVPAPEFVTVEGVFRGRRRAGHGVSSILFDVGGEVAMLADIDVLRLEEVGSST